MVKVYRIGTRPSRLALIQAEEIETRLIASLPNVSFEIVSIYTQGDKDKLIPIFQVEGSDFFTREIDQALLGGEIDFAVHSSKDLPRVLINGLEVVFQTPSISPYEALISRGNHNFNELPGGWRVGTSSARRKEQIKLLRKNLDVVDVRGDIYERIALIEEGKIDALIVAYAALIRLGLEDKASEIFPSEVFSPHPEQGRLSLVAREGFWENLRYI